MNTGTDGSSPGGEGGDVALQECIERYLRSRGKQNGTGTYARTARSELERWAGWLNARELSVADLNRKGDSIMRRYAQHLAQRVESGGIAGSTANSYWSYVQAFCSYAQRDGILDRNPALSETAREELPEAATDRIDQQFWTETQREEIVRWTRDRAYNAVDEDAFEAAVERRDHALVCVLAYTGVRGAEVLAHREDDRRNGLTWRNVDFEAGTVRVLGKDQCWEPALLPTQAAKPIAQWKRVQRPASPDWPVFPTDHAPSKYAAIRDQLDGAEAVLEDSEDIDAAMREYDVVPPALTTDGGRSLLRRLTEQSGIDPGENADYLQLHGARRGLGDTIYRRDRGDAQDVLRHKSLSTTQSAYQHVDAEEQSDRLSEHLSDSL